MAQQGVEAVKKGGKGGKSETGSMLAESPKGPTTKYRAGDEVSVFYRCGENDSYMPVASYAQGLKTPRVGQTHGWVPAVVVEDFDASTGKDVRVR